MAATNVLEGEVLVDTTRTEDELSESRFLGSRWQMWLVRLGLLALLLVLWQLISGDQKTGFALVDKFWVSRPSDIGGRIGDWLRNGSLWFHLAITLQEMAAGFVIGSVTGILAGVVLGRNQWVATTLDPFIIGFNSIPKLALAPLFILWFGIDMQPKIVLVATAVFFLTFLNTYAGVRDVDTELIDILRLMGAGQRQIFFRVILPSATPWIFTGLKLAVPYSLIAAVVGEIMAANRGLGYLLVHAQGQFDTAGVFAAIIILMVLGLIINEGVNRLEHHLLRWRTAGH
ncbi:MAG TPA: ABC transporter permease [Chloroflexota bacterium]|nr:ABC transporter permease [Chloroflexota bacterium]